MGPVRIVDESLSVHAGEWQTSVGRQLGGAVLGVLRLIATRAHRLRRRPGLPNVLR
jgi:hypothetical protein